METKYIVDFYNSHDEDSRLPSAKGRIWLALRAVRSK